MTRRRVFRDVGTGRTYSDGPNGDDDIRERLARIEERMNHMATREDIQKVKVWFLVGVIAAFGVAIPAAVGVAFAAVKLLVP